MSIIFTVFELTLIGVTIWSLDFTQAVQVVAVPETYFLGLVSEDFSSEAFLFVVIPLTFVATIIWPTLTTPAMLFVILINETCILTAIFFKSHINNFFQSLILRLFAKFVLAVL